MTVTNLSMTVTNLSMFDNDNLIIVNLILNDNYQNDKPVKIKNR